MLEKIATTIALSGSCIMMGGLLYGAIFLSLPNDGLIGGMLIGFSGAMLLAVDGLIDLWSQD